MGAFTQGFLPPTRATQSHIIVGLRPPNNHNIEGATQRLCPSFNAAGHKDRGSLIFGEEAGLKFEVRNQARSFVESYNEQEITHFVPLYIY